MTNTDSAEVSRTQRKWLARRENILATAVELVAAEGLAALTIHRLAELLDYSPGALYRYFPSKDALFAELQSRALAEVHDAYLQNDALAKEWSGLKGIETSLQGLFRALAAAYFYLRLDDTLPQHNRLLTYTVSDPAYVLTSTDDLAKIVPNFMALLTTVDDLFEILANDKALAPDDAKQRTVIYWSTLQGIAQMRKLQRIDAHRFAHVEIGLAAAAILLKGWGAPANQIDRARALLDEWAQTLNDGQ